MTISGFSMTRRTICMLLAGVGLAGCLPQQQLQTGQQQPTATIVAPPTVNIIRTPTVPAALVGTPGTRITGFDQTTLNRTLSLINSTAAFETIRVLSSDTYEGRRAGQQSGDLAARYIADQFQVRGLQPWTKLGQNDLFQRFSVPSSGEASNVIGILPGSTSPNSYVILAAHYDSKGRDPSGAYFRGADYNASGVAALLEIARVFQTSNAQPKETIVFAALSGEATGLLGARTLGKKMQDNDLLTRSIMLEVVAIGATGGDFGDIWDQKLRENEVLVDRVMKSARFAGIKMRRNGQSSSSHANFFTTTYKMPAVTVSWALSEGDGSVFHPHLRMLSDTPDPIDQTAFSSALKLVTLSAWVLANDS